MKPPTIYRPCEKHEGCMVPSALHSFAELNDEIRGLMRDMWAQRWELLILWVSLYLVMVVLVVTFQ